MSEQNHYNQLIRQSDFDKKNAGEKAVDYIEDGMTIGLGSGSTVYWMLQKLSEKVKQGLHVKGVPSSKRTEKWANELGIPLTTFHEVQELDLAIDGTDEVDPQLNLLKGGGGSLVREKIVNCASNQVIIIADQSKLVTQLGEAALPIEVLPFGWEVTGSNLRQLGCVTTLRKKDQQVFVSDNGNYILDCKFAHIPDPIALHEELIRLVGVVETGLFPKMADHVILGENNGIRILPQPTR